MKLPLKRQKINVLPPVPEPCQARAERTSPVDDVLHVADGILNAPLLGAQNDPVEVGINHRGAQTLELSHQPAGRAQGQESAGRKAKPEKQMQALGDMLIQHSQESSTLAMTCKGAHSNSMGGPTYCPPLWRLRQSSDYVCQQHPGH